MSVASSNYTASMEYDSQVRDYIALLKPRVMSLVVFTGFVGLWLAPGTIHPFIAMLAIASIALGSGAAGAVNMWVERKSDALMSRTAKRPLPLGKIEPHNALHFAIFLACSSVMVMALATNLVAAGLLSLAILYYVFIYTIWLKRRTPQNIVIGGAAGAFPPMIGWASVTGSLSIEPLLLFLIIFMWTPPHFWALSLYRSDEYKKAGIPMLPVVAGSLSTRWHILIYTILLVTTTLIPYFIGMAGWLYLSVAGFLGGRFLFYAYKLLKQDDEVIAKCMFGFSIFYLFLLFLSFIIDKMVL